MARPTLMKLALVIALTIAAGSAYGASMIAGSAVAVGAASFTPSNNVTIAVDSSAQNYSADAKHLSGDREIAFVNTDAKLYYSSGCVIGSSASDPGGVCNFSNLSSTTGWFSM